MATRNFERAGSLGVCAIMLALAAPTNAALVDARSPPDISIDPLFATVSGANYFAETDLAAGTLKASSTDPSGINTAGPIVQSSVVIEFENISGGVIDFPTGSVSLLVNAAYSETYDSNIGSPTDGAHALLSRLIVSNNSTSTEASVAHDIAYDFTTEGSKSLTRNDLLPGTSNGGQVVETVATGDELLVDLLSGPLSIAPGESLLITASLQALAGADPNLTFTTNAADTAFLTLTLPEGVSVDDLMADTDSDLDWVTVVPIPPALWLFGSALGLLGWVRRQTA